MTEAQDILTRLEARRKALRISRKALAKRTGLSWRTVQAALTGNEGISLPTLLKMAKALGIGLKLSPTQTPRGMSLCQAKAKARELVAITQGSASLEAQAVDDVTKATLEREIEKELLAGPPLRLWA